MTLMAAAGAVIGFSQLRGSGGAATARFVFVLLPVAVVTGWVLVASQPQGNWFRDHVRSWSADLGIDGVVDNLDNHVAVVAFGLGVIFGVRFDRRLLRRRRKTTAQTTVQATVAHGATGGLRVPGTTSAAPSGQKETPASATPPPTPPPGEGETTATWPAPPRDER